MPPSTAAAPSRALVVEQQSPPETIAVDVVVRLRRAVGMLRSARTSGEVVEHIPAAAAVLGFDLALYAHLHGTRWTPVAGHGVGGEARAVDRSLPEWAVLTDHVPAVVDTTPGTGGLVDGWPGVAALAAPVLDRNVAIGLLHAGPVRPWPVPDLDRQLLWMFAEAVGSLLVAARAVGSLHDLASRTIELVGGFAPPDPLRPALTLVPSAALTARESDVLELVAAGLTNGQIARRLVITEGTAKSHLKRILRKLGAANRAEAAAAWTRMSPEGSDPDR